MSTQEDEFRQRLAAILRDLRDAGTDDREAMLLLGGLAAPITDEAGQRSWRGLKRTLASRTRNRIIESLSLNGQALLDGGKDKAAYAVQALGYSLMASTFSDPLIRDGEILLDTIIEAAIVAYRTPRQPESH